MSFALGGGGFKLNTKGSKGTAITLGVTGFDLRGRWHPFKGSFFFGAAAGYQRIYGSASRAVSFDNNGQTETVNTTVNVNIGSFYLTPHLGWLWVYQSGFVLGADLGWQFPFGSKTTADVSTDQPVANDSLPALESTQQYQDLYSQVQDAGNKIGRTSLPYVTVLRAGWFF